MDGHYVLYRDTGSLHCPLPVFISLGCASGNTPGLGAMETAYFPHNQARTQCGAGGAASPLHKIENLKGPHFC